MKYNRNNPLELEDKSYAIKEFTSTLKTKSGADNNISDVFLVEIFLAKYSVYSCKIKNYQNQFVQKICSSC